MIYALRSRLPRVHKSSMDLIAKVYEIVLILVKGKNENTQTLLKYDMLLISHFFSEDLAISKLASKVIGEVLKGSNTLWFRKEKHPL